MTEQAKRAIQQMKQAGFLRSEFKVETERIYQPQYRKEGCRYPYDYGTAQVYVSGCFRDGQYVNGSEMIAEKLDAILAVGLGVMKHIGKSGYTVLIVLTDYSHQGKLQVCDFREDKTVPEFLRPRENADVAAQA